MTAIEQAYRFDDAAENYRVIKQLFEAGARADRPTIERQINSIQWSLDNPPARPDIIQPQYDPRLPVLLKSILDR